ncbi:hypothetical protein PF003_g23600 [Phytophthora fragariae]|nr:hypothetical protein PF003_g23600 [Phytophthora fragariae]
MDVTELNFWELLKRRWACITDNDIVTMASSELPIYDQFTFEFYIYLAPTQRGTTSDVLQRTVFEQQQQKLQHFKSVKGVALGPSPRTISLFTLLGSQKELRSQCQMTTQSSRRSHWIVLLQRFQTSTMR